MQEKGMMSYFLFFIATVLAGTINALAGGGGLITFPLLMLVVTPVTADATSAVALFFAYPTAVWRTRDQLAGVLGSGWLWLLLIPSVLGGLIGAVLLSRMGNRNFIQLVRWLVLVATVIIVLRPILVRLDHLLSERYYRTHECDCAERVLWVFERSRADDLWSDYPSDQRGSRPWCRFFGSHVSSRATATGDPTGARLFTGNANHGVTRADLLDEVRSIFKPQFPQRGRSTNRLAQGP